MIEQNSYNYSEDSGISSITEGYINRQDIYGFCSEEAVKMAHKSGHNIYWTKETVTTELKLIISKLGHFPTHKELKGLSKGDLSRAIDRSGGFYKYAKNFGYSLTRKQAGYWTSEKIIEELKLITSQLTHFPTHTELVNIGRSDLSYAIQHTGGIEKIRDFLGYKGVYVARKQEAM